MRIYMIENLISDYWPFVLSVLAVVVWLVRIEGKVKTNERDIKNIRDDRRQEMQEIKTSLRTINEEMSTMNKAIAELVGFNKGKDCIKPSRSKK
jgi:hypothetical protein